MVYRKRSRCVLEARQRTQRYHRLSGSGLSGGGTNIEHRQRRRIVLKLRIYLQDHLILVVRRIDGRDLPRRVGVPESFFNLPRRYALSGNAHRRHLVSVDDDLQLRIPELQIAADIPEVGKRS